MASTRLVQAAPCLGSQPGCWTWGECTGLGCVPG
jgi:hypothetical protein